MAWTNPIGKAAGNVGLSADWNTYVRDNTNALRDYLLGAQDLGANFLFQAGRALGFTDTDVTHGMTAIAATGVWCSIQQQSATGGGVNFYGLADTDADRPGMQVHGINGFATPTVGGLWHVASKRNGTTVQAFAASEAAMLFINGAVGGSTLGTWYGQGLNIAGGLSVGYAGTPPSGYLSIGHANAFIGGSSTDLTFYSGGSQKVTISTTLGLALTVGINMDATLSATPPAGAILFKERIDPSAPTTDAAHFYVRDNGSGKSQIVVQFNTGAIQVIATQP